MSKTFSLLLALSVASLMLLSACTAKPQSSYTILVGRLSEAADLPTGRIYTSEDTPTQDAPFPAEPLCGELALSLYGDRDGSNGASQDSLFPEEFLLLDDYSVWLCSAQEPYEITVLRTRSVSDTTDAAKMLIRRLEALRKHHRECEHRQTLDSAAVSVSGRYVILEILP